MKGYRLRRTWRWLVRCRYSRGFGIQSPWAYHFVRYVVNEHYPYYAYQDLREAYPELAPEERRLYEFYFRLANYAQADEWLDLLPTSPILEAYVSKGCRHTRIVSQTKGCPGVVRTRADEQLCGKMDDIFGTVGDGSVAVVEGIYRSKEARRCWRQLVTHPRTGVTFDLHACGVMFFDRKRPKMNYKINF